MFVFVFILCVFLYWQRPLLRAKNSCKEVLRRV
jgi:hypothetical protein